MTSQQEAHAIEQLRAKRADLIATYHLSPTTLRGKPATIHAGKFGGSPCAYVVADDQTDYLVMGWSAIEKYLGIPVTSSPSPSSTY